MAEEITRYDVESRFPSEVDDLLCLNDVDLEQLPISNQHKELILEERYTEAGELLESSNIDSMCASLFNLLENRIYATQYHLINKHTKWHEIHGVESPIECFDEPINTIQKPVWSNIEDLSRLGFSSLSSGYSLSNAGGFRP